MPSGGITITPGYQLADGEKVNNAKLNQLGQPVGQVDEGAITDRELASDINDSIALVSQIPAKNLLCNGDFAHWASADYLTNGVTFGNGASGNPFAHDYVAATVSGVAHGSADRWVTPNSANRAFDRVAFSAGQIEVPDNPTYFMRVTQLVAPYSGIDPAYIGQRLEGVFPFSGRTYTFTIWARVFPVTGGVPTFAVKPSCRLYFGSTGSTEIVLPGTPVTLPTSAWIQIKQTFTIPDLAGKTVSGAAPYNYPFTEFRLEMPQSTIFGIDVAHASVVAGDKITAWDQRLPHEDLLFGWRYLQVLGFTFVTAAQLANYVPFVNLRVTMMKDYSDRDVHPAFTGTGATVGVGAIFKDSLFQATGNSILTTGYIIVAGELYCAT